MARMKHQEITRRTVTASRASAAPDLRVQADLDTSRGFSALGAAASDVLGKLGQAATRIRTDRAVKKTQEDQTQGAKDRTVETLSGTAAQAPESLAERTEGYRRGYFLTEAANRLHTTKLEIAREAAKLEPGEDIQPLLQERFATMLQAPEFQDPQVLKQLQPAIAAAQQEIGVARQKTELAEVFERQGENFRTMARYGIKDGSLRTPQGVANFRKLLDTEQFAYISQDEADDMLSGAYADLFERGEVDPETAMEFLQTPLAAGETPLWDREGWTEKFETAIASGATVRQKVYEEGQAEMLSGMEYQLQGKAARGALGIGDINGLADKVGLQGKERLSFVRRWIDQNDAGLKHMQTEANRAKQHKETIAAINAGNAMSLTDAQLKKSAETEWAKAVASGDTKARQAVIERYVRAGIEIPQLKDMLGRTTERNLSTNYELYSQLAKIDRIAADRYLSESNATLFAQHHENITQFGMTPEESIQALPTGATKGKRADVARETASVAARYFKENPTMSDGSPRGRAVQSQIEQQAIRLGIANPNASYEDNLKAAERRVQGGLIQVNGRWVPRGGARPTAAPAIDAFVKEGAADLVREGLIPEDWQGGVYAAPDPNNPNRFQLLLPNGYPVANPKTGKRITFDPLEIAAARADYDSQRTEAEVRASSEANAQMRRDGKRPLTAREQALGFTPRPEDSTVNPLDIRKDPTTADGKPFPAFMDFLQDHRVKRKAEGK